MALKHIVYVPGNLDLDYLALNSYVFVDEQILF